MGPREVMHRRMHMGGGHPRWETEWVGGIGVMAQGQEMGEVYANQLWGVMAAWVGGGNQNRCMHCRRDNNPPHESFVESDSRAGMSYHNHPKSHLHSIT